MEYILHLAIIICFYSILAQSLNLLAGYTGMLSLAQAGFYGLGAYIAAILSTQFHFSFWLDLPFAIIAVAIIAFLISLTALKTVDDYFIICTLGIQVILFSLFNNLSSITNGPNGITNIPSISLFSFTLNQKLPFLIFSILILSVLWFFIKRITKSGFGQTLQSIQEDEIYSSSIGKNVYMTKATVFTLSAAIAAVPGVLFAHYISYINPTSFNVTESVLILSIVIIGGFKNFTGSILAAAFLVLLPEYLRFLGLPDVVAANLRQIIYGLILIAVMITGKNGIAELFPKRKQ